MYTISPSHDKEDEMKSSVPFGELPALEVDLQLYSGVEPIVRYVAKLAGFYPPEPVEVCIMNLIPVLFVSFRATENR